MVPAWRRGGPVIPASSSSIRTRRRRFPSRVGCAGGFAVAVCPGPRAAPCPLLDAGECTSAHGADLVVSALGADDVVDALRLNCPSVPLVVAQPTDDVEALVAAVETALGV
jgi:hypothetical protein